LSLAQERQPWDQVRYWLYDLAQEISASAKDGTLPTILSALGRKFGDVFIIKPRVPAVCGLTC